MLVRRDQLVTVAIAWRPEFSVSRAMAIDTDGKRHHASFMLATKLTAAATPATYLVSAARQGRLVQFHRGDVASAFTTARRLRSLGWRTVVEDPFAGKSTDVRAVSR